MVDRELNLIYSFFSKCESDVKVIVSIINILSKNNYEVNKFEIEIREIKEKLRNVEKKILESRNKSNHIELSSEKYILEKCHESLQSLKGSIINYKEIKMNSNATLKAEKNSQLSDCELQPVNDLLNDKFSQLRISKRDIDQVSVGDSISGHFVSELKVDDKNGFETKCGNIKLGNNVDESIDGTNEFKHSIGFRVNIFQRLNTDILDSSFKNKLDAQDSIGKHIQYTPRMVWHNPRHDFPSSPLNKFTNISLFDKLSLDTLFFIFYFQQGTFQQFMSIQELKKKKWLFHKKCFAWFYKRSDSKLITEDAEIADYIYFDFEKDWCQKVKNDFTFEFIHLDNAPVVINKDTNGSNTCSNNRSCVNNDQTVIHSDISENIINTDSMIGDNNVIKDP